MAKEYDPSAAENQQKISDQPFVAAVADLAAGGDRPYLGDTETVEALLRGAVADVMGVMRPDVPADKRVNAVRKKSKEVGLILLGLDPAYAPVRKWNAPGGIDTHCAKWLALGDQDPADVMTHALVKLFGEVLDVANYAAEPGVLDEQWRFQIDGLIERYLALFTGMTPGMLDALM
jgi:hypothetical protein